MSSLTRLRHPAPRPEDLETPLGRVEEQLHELQAALRGEDPDALESAAVGLHRALAAAVEHFRLAARHGGIPQPMRVRLASASARVAAQREALARATASLDRAIEVLLPSVAPTYGADGTAARPAHRGSMLA
jgi:hypothetical protein